MGIRWKRAKRSTCQEERTRLSRLSGLLGLMVLQQSAEGHGRWMSRVRWGGSAANRRMDEWTDRARMHAVERDKSKRGKQRKGKELAWWRLFFFFLPLFFFLSIPSFVSFLSHPSLPPSQPTIITMTDTNDFDDAADFDISKIVQDIDAANLALDSLDGKESIVCCFFWAM